MVLPWPRQPCARRLGSPELGLSFSIIRDALAMSSDSGTFLFLVSLFPDDVSFTSIWCCELFTV